MPGFLRRPALPCTTPTHPHNLTRPAGLPAVASKCSPHPSSHNLASPSRPQQTGGIIVVSLRPIIQSSTHPINHSPIIQSFTHPIIHSPIIQSCSHPVIHSINHPVANHPIIQSIPRAGQRLQRIRVSHINAAIAQLHHAIGLEAAQDRAHSFAIGAQHVGQ